MPILYTLTPNLAPFTMSPTSYNGSHCTPGILSDSPLDPPRASLTCAQSLELASVLGEVRQLHVPSNSSGLETQQAELHRRLNELHSLTRALPTEVLITIFHFTFPPIDFTPSTTQFTSGSIPNVPERHAQITFSRVCCYWRHIIQSTPEFWSTAVIKVKRTPLSLQRKNSLLQLYLDNVSSMRISLELDFGVVPTAHLLKYEYMEVLPIFHSILDRAHKFKLLSLILPLSSWIPHISSAFTNLEDYRIQDVVKDKSVRHSDRLSIPLSTMPNLRHLYLHQTQPMQIPVRRQLCHHPTIAALCMHNLPLNTCLHMLIACPNLVEYRCRPSGSTLADGTQIPRLHFPHMKIFYAPGSFYHRIAHNLHLPVVETLGLGLSSNYNDGILSPIIAFLQHLPATWSTFTLTFLHRIPIPWDTSSSYSSAVSRLIEVVKKIFRCIPHHVRSLHLLKVSHVGPGIIFKALGDTTTRVFISGLRHIYLDTSCLPSVYSMDSDGFDNSYEVRREGRLSVFTSPKLFVKMLQARKEQLTGGEFWLEVETEDGMYWCHVEKSLQEFIRSTGISVRITQAGMPVRSLKDVYGNLGNFG